MQCVVDTSALIAVVANEPTKQGLVRVTRGYDLLSPASVHWEIGNALAAGLKRNRFSYSEASAALLAYDDIPVRFVGVQLSDALAVADELAIYAYDAYVLVCARSQRCSMLSLDRSLVEAARRLGLDVLEVNR